MNTVRTFLALDLGDFYASEIGGLIDSIRHKVFNVKWTNPSSVHLTLHFFGSVPESEISVVTEALSGILKEERPFELFLNGVGAFPCLAAPRVFWVGLDGEVAVLNAVRNKCEKRLLELGYPAEDREFMPHLTLGRSRRRESPAVFPKSVLSFSTARKYSADRFTLFRSDLFREGSRHTPLHQFLLKGGSDDARR